MMRALTAPFGSIAVKLSSVLIAMGAMTAAAIIVGMVVFTMLAGSIRTMTTEVLPSIGSSLQVIERSTSAGNALSGISFATDSADLEKRAHRFTLASKDLRMAVKQLAPSSAEAIAPRLDGLDTAAERVQAALRDRFAADAEMRKQIKESGKLAAEARNRLIELADDAYFDLTIGGEKTLGMVNGRLSTLVEGDFATMRAVLETRGEINLAASLVLAISQTADPALAEVLRGQSATSVERLNVLLDGLAKTPSLTEPLAPVRETRNYLTRLAKQGFPDRTGMENTLLAMRTKSETALGAIIDSLSHDLAAMAQQTATASESAIRDLLESQVGHIREAADLDGAVKSLLIAALLGGAVDTIDAVDGAQAAVTETAGQLTLLAQASTISDELRDLIGRIGAIADPDFGIIAARRDSLDAQAQFIARTADANAALTGISAAANAEGQTAMRAIAIAGTQILGQTTLAQERMRLITLLSIGILLMAPVITWLLILRPMKRVTRVTERLAQGDLAPVTGFERTGGEIGRMARALSVFRNGLIERQEMQEQAEKQRLAQIEAERQAEADARRREVEARAAEAAREEEERKREAEEAERRAEMQRAAEAEREARAAEQARVVAALAQGLDELAAGDLACAIGEQFPPSYEALRLNFNAAVGTLASVIRELTSSAELVDGSSHELAEAAGELAARTERTAATLEETAAAVTELSTSASSAAERTREVDAITRKARGAAEASSSVVTGAVETMAAIGASSTTISKIVDLIETIAFQTNLLALNAGVEAARAGEDGRGFAVVANEVRALAQRCSDAAREISEQIATTRSQIEKGVDQVGEAGRALESIIGLVQDVAGQVSGLTQSSSEQARVISEIQTAVSHLDEATQQNAAMFEESFAASQTLTGEARKLAQLSEKFRTEEGDVTRRSAA